MYKKIKLRIKLLDWRSSNYHVRNKNILQQAL